MLKRSDKEQLVAELANTLREAPAVAVASFQALTMADSTALRRSLRPGGGRVRVVPKRLFRRVAETLGWPASLAETTDSIGVAWGTDLLAPAKGLHGFVKGAKGAMILGGVLEGRVLTGTDVTTLAELPALESLRAQFVGLVAAPMRGLVGVMGGVLRGLPAVLQAKAAQG